MRWMTRIELDRDVRYRTVHSLVMIDSPAACCKGPALRYISVPGS